MDTNKLKWIWKSMSEKGVPKMREDTQTDVEQYGIP